LCKSNDTQSKKTNGQDPSSIMKLCTDSQRPRILTPAPRAGQNWILKAGRRSNIPIHLHHDPAEVCDHCFAVFQQTHAMTATDKRVVILCRAFSLATFPVDWAARHATRSNNTPTLPVFCAQTGGYTRHNQLATNQSVHLRMVEAITPPGEEGFSHPEQGQRILVHTLSPSHTASPRRKQ